MALALLVPLAVAFVHKVRHGGYILPPDARYYVTMTLRNLGWDLPDALREAQRHVSSPAYPWFFSAGDQTWRMVQARMLYPLLSAPFVALFGVTWGMLVVPALSLAYFSLGTARLLNRLYGPLVAVLVAGAFTLTAQISSGIFYATPDALALALFTMLLTNSPIAGRQRPLNTVLAGLAVLLLCITRQVGPVPLGLIGAGWLWEAVRRRAWCNEWLAPLAVTAVIVLGNQFLIGAIAPYDFRSVFLRVHDQPDMASAIRALPGIVYRLFRAEWLFMFRNDTLLLVLVATALGYMVLRLPRLPAGLMLGTVLPIAVLVVGLGIPSRMRYESIGFPVAALCVGALFASVTPPVYGRRPPAERRGRGDPESPGPDGPGAPDAPDAPDVPDTLEAPDGPVVPTHLRRPARAEEPTASEFRGPAARGASPRGFRTNGFRTRGVGAAVVTAVVSVAAFGGVVAYSLNAGSASVSGRMPPPSPAYPAAEGGKPYALRPVARKPAEATLENAFETAVKLVEGSDYGGRVFDYRHPFRYRPVTPRDQRWRHRAPDGTAVLTGFGDLTGRQSRYFGAALSLEGEVDPGTVRILRRSAGEYGEDVVFEVRDTSGGVHRGRATTLYPTLRADWPGLVTELVFDAGGTAV